MQLCLDKSMEDLKNISAGRELILFGASGGADIFFQQMWRDAQVKYFMLIIIGRSMKKLRRRCILQRV